MSTLSLDKTASLLEKFRLFTQLIERFSDAKKQLRLVRNLIINECKSIKSSNFLLSKRDHDNLHYYMDELCEIVSRFERARNTDNYNRARKMLKRYGFELNATIEEIEAESRKKKCYDLPCKESAATAPEKAAEQKEGATV